MKKLLILSLIAVVLFSGCVGQPKTQLTFAGQTMNFRSDLNEAESIPVQNATLLRDILLGPHCVSTFIAYYPNDTENSYYLAAAYELAYKLKIINDYYWPGSNINIKAMPLNSSDELFATEEEPVILLLGPSRAQDTSVKIDGYLITASGKDFSEIDRTYTDLDLAADKILLVLMEQNNL